MFIPTISENDARKQARDVLKSIVAVVDLYDFESFFKETVYCKNDIYYMKGSEEVFEALKLTQDVMKILAKSIQTDMAASNIKNINVIPRKDHVELKRKNCCYIVTKFSDYAKSKPSLEIMKHFKEYNIVFYFACEEIQGFGGKYMGKTVDIVKIDDNYNIIFPDNGRLGKFDHLEDARRFLELFH
jgi:hypothetical protein